MKEKLTFLHTNDLHGQYDLASRQSAFIKKRKQELMKENHNVIVVDGGDHMDMSMNECLATNGYIHLDMMSATGYDAMSVGNNELLRLPKEKIRQLSIDSKVPWLLLNLTEADGSQIGGTKKSLILQAGEYLKIGLFGATDLFEDLYERKHGFKNLDTVSEIKKEVSSLKSEGANLIVFLSHLGLEADRKLAKELSSFIDIIIGAHTHNVLPKPENVSNVIIVQAGSYGQYVGELTVTVDLTTINVIDYTGRLTEMTLADEQDPDLEEVLMNGRLQAEQYLSEVLTESPEDISHEQLVKLTADSLKEYWHTEIGIMYGGGLTEGLKSGTITKRNMLDICKSMHTPIVMELTGKQIAGLIKETYLEDVTNKPIYGGGFRPHGIPIGKLQFSGISWTGEREEVSDIRVNGEEINFSITYQVATGTPLLYEEVCGYPSVVGSKLIQLGENIMIKDVVMDFLKKQYAKRKTTV
ncbi:bifunctional metallophosphatase/5'-nucleotidase [Fictibacillus phosphorivorans]|uniref:bifunctional metallophosphatase/5'-nucleotidase n=1 Tax=Fictibacillus phosphorivorans TaxID=1221500 RepID=UPI00203DE9F6|nr:bifunctional UDP-sugar hydrolase/5'-nucleotidase [Fictibacillus phosphorivorans]MCM3719057.1 bifunctional metallophosphatase/5'-nucleotidase [Fictibacillus phosphorivorans]MCM3776679.1 bifunctional metallophosphatase/5'-nucleotidase [Fictibacillus phosphorivorans]